MIPQSLKPAGRSDLLVALLVLLPFVNIPFLGSVNVAGKHFFLAFGVMALFLAALSRRRTLDAPCVFWVPLLLLLSLTVSSLLALHPGPALLGVGIVSLGVLLLWLAWAMAVSDETMPERLVDGLMATGTVAALLGLYEYVHYLLLGPTAQMLIPFLLPPDRNYRVGGLFGQPNHFALFLTICLLAFCYRYLHPPAGHRQSRLHAMRHLPPALLAAVFFLTWSRAGLLSLAILFGLLAWLVASGRYLDGERGQRWEFVKFLLCLGAGLLFARLLPELLAGGFLDAPTVTSVSSDAVSRKLNTASLGSEARLLFWSASLLIFLSHPWAGVGLNHFQFFYPKYALKAHDLLGFVSYEAMRPVRWSHNEPLQLLCEGGVVAFGLVLLLLSVYLFRLGQSVLRARRHPPLFLYAHLFLLPFVLQSMLSWTMRHPALWALFLAWTGILLSRYPLRIFVVAPAGRRLLLLVVVAGWLGTSFLLYQEVRMGSFFQKLRSPTPLSETLAEFKLLCDNPYSENRVLKRALPVYFFQVLEAGDREMAAEILPYARRLADLQGVYWQWNYLANLYFLLDRQAEARAAIKRATILQPTHEPSWAFLHYLNILEAARKTGRPVEEFYPKGVNPLSIIEEFARD